MPKPYSTNKDPFAVRKTKIVTTLSEHYVVYGIFVHRSGFNTSEAIASVVSNSVLVLAPPILIEHLKEKNPKLSIRSHHSVLKSQPTEEFVVFLLGKWFNNDLTTSVVLKRKN